VTGGVGPGPGGFGRQLGSESVFAQQGVLAATSGEARRDPRWLAQLGAVLVRLPGRDGGSASQP